VESTLVEVLILNGFGAVDFYKVVTWAARKILGEFEELRVGGA